MVTIARLSVAFASNPSTDAALEGAHTQISAPTDAREKRAELDDAIRDEEEKVKELAGELQQIDDRSSFSTIASFFIGDDAGIPDGDAPEPSGRAGLLPRDWPLWRLKAGD